MENIKESIIEHIGESDYNDILCAEINYDTEDTDDICVSLCINGNVSEFLDKLDYTTDEWRINDAIIWWKSGAWSRYEPTYDHNYYHWYYYKLPTIPDTCKAL